MNEENIEETTFDNHGYKEEIEYAGFWKIWSGLN